MTRIDVPAGQDPKAYLNTAFSADIVGAAQALYRACYANGSLTLREFEGARMRMAEINGCQLCRNWRSGGPEAAAMIAGSELAGRETVADRGPAPDEDYYAAVSRWRDHPGFSERERLAIGYAEYMSLDPKGLAADDDFWGRLHAVYTDAEIVDLSYCVFAWFQGRVSHALGVDGACALPV
jgi:alkylhydroperoxidase family enzyme